MNFSNLLKKFIPKKTIVTHDGSFHADEIMATAILSIYEKGRIKVIRTRDELIAQKADYVIDVGGVYDPIRKRYDHHQKGGAGKRENEVEYATAGLIWKHYGPYIVTNKELFERIDRKLMQPIDLNDNGQSKFYSDFIDVYPYTLSSIVGTRKPTWTEEDTIDLDREFKNLVSFFKDILIREIEINKDDVLAKKYIADVLEKTIDERYIVLGKFCPFNDALEPYPRVLYVIYPRKDKSWGAQCVRKERGSFENRKSFPQEWAGLREHELKKITNIPSARFCHRSLYLCVSETKEGAIKLVEKALES